MNWKNTRRRCYAENLPVKLVLQESLMNTLSFKCIALLCSTLLAGTACAAGPPEPSPKWQPVQVVNLQLEALRNNDAANDNGIATAYGFASPRNKASVGELADFTRMMHAGYPDMLTHVGADLETLEVQGDEAAIGVTLQLQGTGRSKYIFLLKRYSGNSCDGCWLTDGVIPVEREEPAPLRQI